VRSLQQKTTKFSKKDVSLWFLIAAILLGLVSGDLYFSALNASLKWMLALLMILISLGMLALTQQGKNIGTFIKEAHRELKKVVWPSRKETLQTSFLIFLVVLIISLILWGVDSVFSLLISSILV